jgi:pilus assembly protein Flp/PilA
MIEIKQAAPSGAACFLLSPPRTRRSAANEGGKVMKKFFQNKSGTTAIEYGLIAALIAVVIIGAAGTLGNAISTTFGSVSTAMAGS